MSELIARLKLKREEGYLYYVKSNEEGFLCIYKVVAKRGRNKGKKEEDDK